MSSTHEQNNQVNVVVTEDQKSRWQDYLEQHGAEFQSLSQLIRQAFEKVVSNEPMTGSGFDGYKTRYQ